MKYLIVQEMLVGNMEFVLAIYVIILKEKENQLIDYILNMLPPTTTKQEMPKGK